MLLIIIAAMKWLYQKIVAAEKNTHIKVNYIPVNFLYSSRYYII